MTLSSFIRRAFPSACFDSPTIVGCDDYGTEAWSIERDASLGVGDVVRTTARGCNTSSKVHLSVKREKNGIPYEFCAIYDDLDEVDAARAGRELNEWLSRASVPAGSPSAKYLPSTQPPEA